MLAFIPVLRLEENYAFFADEQNAMRLQDSAILTVGCADGTHHQSTDNAVAEANATSHQSTANPVVDAKDNCHQSTVAVANGTCHQSTDTNLFDKGTVCLERNEKSTTTGEF